MPEQPKATKDDALAKWEPDAVGRVYGGRVAHVLNTLKGGTGKAFCGETLWRHHWYKTSERCPRCRACARKAYA